FSSKLHSRLRREYARSASPLSANTFASCANPRHTLTTAHTRSTCLPMICSSTRSLIPRGDVRIFKTTRQFGQTTAPESAPTNLPNEKVASLVIRDYKEPRELGICQYDVVETKQS